jgi:hypothetical protein
MAGLYIHFPNKVSYDDYRFQQNTRWRRRTATLRTNEAEPVAWMGLGAWMVAGIDERLCAASPRMTRETRGDEGRTRWKRDSRSKLVGHMGGLGLLIGPGPEYAANF